MWKISICSLVILAIFIVAYFENALNLQFTHEIKMMFTSMFFIWLISTAYWIYQLNQRKGKIQTKLGEV